MKSFKCKKCGNEEQDCISIRHDVLFDRLGIKCQICDYRWQEDPLDKGPRKPTIEDVIVLHYDEKGLEFLIKDLLGAPEVFKFGGRGLEFRINAYGPYIRSQIRDWLLVKERLINDKMMITESTDET